MQCTHCGNNNPPDRTHCYRCNRPFPSESEPPPAPRIAVGELVADRFRVKRLLGVGGMGQVFEAFDERLERTIALKILLGEHLGSAKARQRFEREAKVIARVRHPNVIEIFDYFPYGDDLVLALEYLSGGTLADRIGRGLAVTEVVRMGRGLLAGLGAIHKAGLVHRDIKPANVLLTADDEPKIADLGIAHDSMGRSMTRTGARMGTPEYMSRSKSAGRRSTPARTSMRVGSCFTRC